MARNSSRLLPLVGWQYLRLGLAISALPLALWACDSHPLKEPLPNPQMETDFSVPVSPEREVDILFMVDNSPSMDPKQQALAKNFPLMIQKLQALPGGLPDVHIGVVSSDMGAGSEGAGVNCARVLGDRGLLWGNDTNNMTASVAAGSTAASDPNHPLSADGCGLNKGARWIVDIAKPDGTRNQNYAGNLTDVFSCLATAVGVNGCGYEHQLQSVRVALNPQDGVNPENRGFVRPKAYLAIILITDEDDCSANPSDVDNNAMFQARRSPETETGSLRCAARGHICGGQDIPDYTDPMAGYTGSGFTHNFSDCAPKSQSTPANPAEMPLIDVNDIIASIQGTPGYVTDANGNFVMNKDANGKDIAGSYSTQQKRANQLLVSGIIGWPPDGDLPGVTTNKDANGNIQYQIGKDSTAINGQDKYWDYMPICQLPGVTSNDGNIYKAYGGLRLKKFLDAFKRTDLNDNQNVFSICNNDFTSAMQQIGDAIVNVLKPGCVNYPLIDTDPSTPGVQPQCTVIDQIPCDTPGQGTCPRTGIVENPLNECKDTAGKVLDPANPNLNSVPNDNTARPCWYLVYNSDPTTGCPGSPNNQTITALRKDNLLAPQGTNLSMQCLTCARSDQQCPSWTPPN